MISESDLRRSGALFDPDQPERFRYLLWRNLRADLLDRAKPERVIGGILCNPSIAGVEVNDPTAVRMINYSAREDGTLYLLANKWPYISTDPKALKRAIAAGEDVLGAHGDAAIRWVIERADLVIVGWGNLIRDDDRSAWIASVARELGKTLWCLGANQDGSPKHPLYRPAAEPLVPWIAP